MGKAYSEESRDQVKQLLEQDVAEDEIEKQTGVSDRTIRRWKLELDRYGRIGKPPESRTGRHRVMNKDVEQALFDHVATKPDMSVDDMLWWLHDKYKLVVGTRTIRRAFERRNTSHKKFRQNVRKELRASRDASASLGATADVSGDHSHLSHADNTYQSPYAPMANMGNNTSVSDISPELAHALGGLAQTNDNIHPDLVGDNVELSEDEETMQLQLQQIALERREIELKLRMRRMQKARQSSQTPRMLTDAHDQSFFTDLTSTPDVPGAHPPTDNTVPNEMSPTANPNPKPRDSRSKSKVEEAKKRTEERQERMLKDLEKRSRRREHLTAEWVQSRDVWAKGPEKLLVNLMHQHATYAYNQNSLETFEAIFRELYQLVDHEDWYGPVHDDLLRERTRRKMSQLRSKMVKSGEIVSRGEGYGGWFKASDDQNMAGVNGGADASGLSLVDQHHMTNMPMDLGLGGEGNEHESHAQSEETMVARDAMMHAGHDHQDLLQHGQQMHSLHGQQAFSDPEMHHSEYTHLPDEDMAHQHELMAQRGMAQHEQMSHQQAMEEGIASMGAQDNMTM